MSFVTFSPRGPHICSAWYSLFRDRTRDEEEQEKVTWVTTGYLEMSNCRRKLFVSMDNALFPLLTSPLPSSSFSPVRAINLGFSSLSVSRSFMPTWLLQKAAPSKRKTHYESKVRQIPDHCHRDGFRFTGWTTGWLTNQKECIKRLFLLFIHNILFQKLCPGVEAVKIATKRYARKQNKWGPKPLS